MKKLLVIDFKEKVKYKDAWDLQKKLHDLRVRNIIYDILILLEHFPIITLGKFGNENNLLKTEEELKDIGIDFLRVDRGGDITYHGPLQLVGYFIFKVEGVKNFVLKIERSIINVLNEYGIEAKENLEYPGVWVGNRKIAAIGIAIKKKVSYHGFALNVSNDLTPFSYIIPCGLKDKKVTSILREADFSPSMEDVKKKVCLSVIKEFGFDSFKVFNFSSYKELPNFDMLLEDQ